MTDSMLSRLYQKLSDGSISRRDFINRASATGVGVAGAVFLANANTIAAAVTSTGHCGIAGN